MTCPSMSVLNKHHHSTVSFLHRKQYFSHSRLRFCLNNQHLVHFLCTSEKHGFSFLVLIIFYSPVWSLVSSCQWLFQSKLKLNSTLQVLKLNNTDIINNNHFNFLPLLLIYLLGNALIWGRTLLLNSIHNGKQHYHERKFFRKDQDFEFSN